MKCESVHGSGGHDKMNHRYRVLMLAPTGFFSDYGCQRPDSGGSLVLQKRGHRLSICTYHRDVIWAGWTSSAFRAYRGDATTAWGPHGTS